MSSSVVGHGGLGWRRDGAMARRPNLYRLSSGQKPWTKSLCLWPRACAPTEGSDTARLRNWSEFELVQWLQVGITEDQVGLASLRVGPDEQGDRKIALERSRPVHASPLAAPFHDEPSVLHTRF